MVVQQLDRGYDRRFRVFLIDPGYLAPHGVETTLTARGAEQMQVTDLVFGDEVPVDGNECPLVIEPGAFRALDVVISK
jgi:hypothetical protein